jgi:hypothetical protein
MSSPFSLISKRQGNSDREVNGSGCYVAIVYNEAHLLNLWKVHAVRAVKRGSYPIAILLHLAENIVYD